jgi:hypothetical protein
VQVLPAQYSRLLHCVQLDPQLFGSSLVSTQVPKQSLVPGAQAQVPPEQTSPVLQAVKQFLQCCGSVFRLTQPAVPHD